MSCGYSRAQRFSTQHPFTFGVDFEAEHQAQVKLIDVRANRLSFDGESSATSPDISKAMTMSEGALTRYFDLPRGKWRINATEPGFKVVAVALEGLRHRLFPLRQVHGMPTWYYYY